MQVISTTERDEEIWVWLLESYWKDVWRWIKKMRIARICKRPAGWGAGCASYSTGTHHWGKSLSMNTRHPMDQPSQVLWLFGQGSVVLICSSTFSCLKKHATDSATMLPLWAFKKLEISKLLVPVLLFFASVSYLLPFFNSQCVRNTGNTEIKTWYYCDGYRWVFL